MKKRPPRKAPPQRRKSGDRTAEALRESEARFRSIFNGVAIGIALVGIDGHPQACNPALERMLGFSEAELRAMSFAEFTHPDDVSIDLALFEELRRGVRDQYQIEKRYIRKDARLVWARLTVSLLRDAEGSPSHMIGMAEDITASRSAGGERERLVHNLGERVKELTALHQAAPILQDQQLDVPVMLDRIAALLPPAFQYPDVTAGSVRCGSAISTTTGYRETPWMLVTDFVTSDGTTGTLNVVYLEERPAEVEGPFLAEERRLLDSLAEMLVTALERRTAERSLQVSQERLEMALAAAGMGIWEWDLETERVTWSEELERIAGLGPGAFPGTLEAFRAMVPAEDLSGIQTAIGRAIEDRALGDRFESEFRMIRRDGETRWLVSTGRVLRDAKGTPLRMLGMAHDVSGLRQLEQQFRQSQKMEAMGRLAGGVAHDFNNLLTAIKGYSEFVIDALEPGDQRRDDVGEIAAAAERAAGLTRQLLAFSRHQVLAPRVIDPNVVVAGMEKLLRRLIGADIELRVDLSREPVAIRIDPGQLEQVLMNLAVNARDAMPNGGTLTVETAAVDFDERITAERMDIQPGRYVVLAVTDTGTGMTPETRSRLFEPFFTTKDMGRGTGLGLATVYGIVKQSGGSVWVYSELGKGATFKVYLPIVASDIEAVDVSALPAPTLRGSETVLFVDDDLQVRALAERALRAHGYRALIAANGVEALGLSASAGRPIDLLVTDVVMPRMRGPDLAVRIRMAHTNVRVLYITGYTERSIEQELALSAAVLQKPFTPRGLIRSIRETLDRV